MSESHQRLAHTEMCLSEGWNSYYYHVQCFTFFVLEILSQVHSSIESDNYAVDKLLLSTTANLISMTQSLHEPQNLLVTVANSFSWLTECDNSIIDPWPRELWSPSVFLFTYLICVRAIISHMVPCCNKEKSWCEISKVHRENRSDLVSGQVQTGWICSMPVVYKATHGWNGVHISPVGCDKDRSIKWKWIVCMGCHWSTKWNNSIVINLHAVIWC